MLARLQQLITLLVFGSALAWLLYFGVMPLFAIAGFLLIVFGYSIFLALEFVLLRFINRSDPAPQPRTRELFGAWIDEALVAPRVFFWRQPFRSQAVPDRLEPAAPGMRGVVLIHGFFCNRGFWTPWLEQLEASGRPFVAVSLEPILGSIDEYAAQIDEAVCRVTAASGGLPPLLVCHSMGGLAARAWLKLMKAEGRVHHVVTIGTPHGGTWLAGFSHGENGRQMRLLSDWRTALDHEMPEGRHALFTCWYSNCDNIVFPTSTATLAGADNRLLRGVAHVRMAFLPEVMARSLALLDGP
jgi:triacylglycerol esterase/lipase EstA (alpha/beta hydrolase family)